jgi:hypothetical protein
LVRWLHALWAWLAEGKVVFMGLLVVIATLLLGMVTWQSEVSIRISGFALQFVGMIFAARGLLQIRAHFSQTLLRNLFIQWLKRFPKWKGRTVNLSDVSMSARATMSADETVWTPDSTERSLEQRIQAIVENLDRLRSEQSQQKTDIKELKDSHEKHRKEVAENTERLEKTLRTDLESLHTADLLTSLVGLGWLTSGIFLSTVAPELHGWLSSA